MQAAETSPFRKKGRLSQSKLHLDPTELEAPGGCVLVNQEGEKAVQSISCSTLSRCPLASWNSFLSGL